MALFQFSQEDTERYILEQARKHLAEIEWQAEQPEPAAVTPAPKSRPAPAPRIDPNNPSDPWLQATESSPELAAEKPARPGTEQKLSPAVYAAVTFLSEALSDGQAHRSSVLLAQAQKRGITEPTLRRARLAIGATTEKVAKEWLWQLPSE